MATSLHKAAIAVCNDLTPAIAEICATAPNPMGMDTEKIAQSMLTRCMNNMGRHSKVIAQSINEDQMPLTIAAEVMIRLASQILLDAGQPLALMKVQLEIARKIIPIPKSV